jgi:hypothetical protein
MLLTKMIVSIKTKNLNDSWICVVYSFFLI